MSGFDWSLELGGPVVYVDGIVGGSTHVLVDYTRTLVPEERGSCWFWRCFVPALKSYLFKTMPVLLICETCGQPSTLRTNHLPRVRNVVKKTVKSLSMKLVSHLRRLEGGVLLQGRLSFLGLSAGV